MKTKTTHTPGPWKVGAFGAVYTGGVQPMAAPGPLPTAILIAQAKHGSDLLSVKTKEESWANARLIAAAPELADFAREFLLQVSSAQARANPQILDALEDMARAAIAKAEGR